MRRDGPRWRRLAPLLVLSLALALAACEDDTAKSESITPKPVSASGTLDTSFGAGNGYVTYSSLIVSGGGTGQSNTVTLTTDSQGRLLLGGNQELTSGGGVYDATVTRLMPLGGLDISFGASGVARITNGAGSDVIYSVATSGSEIVAVGQRCTPCNVVGLWRFLSNGMPKTTPVTTDNGVGGGAAFGLATYIDSTGNTVIAGGDNVAVGVWRYLPDDTLDATNFNSGGTKPGMRRITPSIDANAYAAAHYPPNKIILAGYTIGTNYEMYVTRLLADGTTDNGTFNASGGVPGQLTDPGAGDDTIALAVKVLSDGKILLAGYTTNTTPIHTDAVVWRLTAAGILDPTFGTSGKVTLDGLGGTASVNDRFTSIAIDGQNRIVLAGVTQAPTNNALVIVRMMSNGTLDTSFSGDGKFVETTDIFNPNLGGPAVIIASSGHILAAGTVAITGADNSRVWKLK